MQQIYFPRAKIRVKPIFLFGRNVERATFTYKIEETFEEIMENQVKEVMDVYKKRLVESHPEAGIDLLEPETIRYKEDVERIMGVDADVLLIRSQFGSWYNVPATKYVLEKVELPIIFFYGKNFIWYDLSDLYGNLKADHKDVYFALDFGDIVERIRILKVKKQMENTKVLLFGHAFPASQTIAANPPSIALVKEKLGVEIKQYEIKRLLGEMRKEDDTEAKKIAEKWIEESEKSLPEAEGIYKYEVNCPPKDDIVDHAKMYLALKRVIKQENAHAVTADCRTMDYDTDCRLIPCYPFTALMGEGIITGCEADISALLTEIILSYISDKPSWMGCLTHVDPEKNWIELSHCSATLNMDSFNAPFVSHIITDYHLRAKYGRKPGMTSWGNVFREGEEVTVGRIDKNLENMSIMNGKIILTGFGRAGVLKFDERDTLKSVFTEPEKGKYRWQCASYMRVKIDNGRDFIDKCYVGPHYAVVYGNWVTEVKELCKKFGVGILEQSTTV